MSMLIGGIVGFLFSAIFLSRTAEILNLEVGRELDYYNKAKTGTVIKLLLSFVLIYGPAVAGVIIGANW